METTAALVDRNLAHAGGDFRCGFDCRGIRDDEQDAIEVAEPRHRAARPPRRAFARSARSAARGIRRQRQPPGFLAYRHVCLDEQVSALLLAGDFMTASRSR